MNLLKELQISAQLSAIQKHWKVFISSAFMTWCGFLKDDDFQKIKDPKYVDGYDSAVLVLATNNKKNRIIREGFYKSLSPLGDVILKSKIEDTIPGTEDLRKPNIIWNSSAMGIQILLPWI